MKTGERIHLLRRRHNWSQRELADLAGLNSNTLARMERSDIADPGGQVLARLARTMETTTDYLLGLTDDPKPHGTHQEVSP